MPSSIKFLCFLLALPVLATIGHDGYMAYLDIEADNPEPLKLTALGWLWENYSPTSHDWAKEAIGPDVWKNIVTPVLQLKALFATLGLAIFIYALLFICSKLGIWPFNDNPGLFRDGSKAKADPFAFDANLSDKKEKIKYKRK